MRLDKLLQKNISANLLGISYLYYKIHPRHYVFLHMATTPRIIPSTFKFPETTAEEYLRQSVGDILSLLQDPPKTLPFLAYGDDTKNAIKNRSPAQTKCSATSTSSYSCDSTGLTHHTTSVCTLKVTYSATITCFFSEGAIHCSRSEGAWLCTSTTDPAINHPHSLI